MQYKKEQKKANFNHKRRGDNTQRSKDLLKDFEQDNKFEASTSVDPEIVIPESNQRKQTIVQYTEEKSRFIACSGLDWATVQAKDIFVLANSFVPKGGRLLKVLIVRSHLGKTKLSQERENGINLQPFLGVAFLDTIALFPKYKKKFAQLQKKYSDVLDIDEQTKLIKNTMLDEDNELQEMVSRRAVTDQAIERTKYAFALLEFNNSKAADTVYIQIDQLEFEDSGYQIDCSVVPTNSMEQMQKDYILDSLETQGGDIVDSCSEAPLIYEKIASASGGVFQTKPAMDWDSSERWRQNLLGGKMTEKQMDQLSNDEKLLGRVLALSEEETDSDNLCDSEDEEEDEQGETENEFQNIDWGAKSESEISDEDVRRVIKGSNFKTDEKLKINFKTGLPSALKQNTELTPFQKYLASKGQTQVADISDLLKGKKAEQLIIGEEQQKGKKEYDQRIVNNYRKLKSRIEVEDDKREIKRLEGIVAKLERQYPYLSEAGAKVGDLTGRDIKTDDRFIFDKK